MRSYHRLRSYRERHSSELKMRDIVTKYYRIEQLKRQLVELETERNELLTAKKLLEEKRNRKIYLLMKHLMIEVTYDEIIEYIQERIEIIDLLIKKINNEIRKLEKEVSSLK